MTTYRKEYEIDNITNSLINCLQDFKQTVSDDFPFDVSSSGGIVTFNTYNDLVFDNTIMNVNNFKVASHILYNSKQGDCKWVCRLVSFGDLVGFQVCMSDDPLLDDSADENNYINPFRGNLTILNTHLDIINSDFTRNSGGGNVNCKMDWGLYAPMPTLYNSCSKLIINYDDETDTVMLTELVPITYYFDGFSHIQYLSHSICIGRVMERGSWIENTELGEGIGFWYGGDMIASLELAMRSNIINSYYTTSTISSNPPCTVRISHTSIQQYVNSVLTWQLESGGSKLIKNHLRGSYCNNNVNDVWYDNPVSLYSGGYTAVRLPNTNSAFNRFEAFLRINMDSAMDRKKDYNMEPSVEGTCYNTEYASNEVITYNFSGQCSQSDYSTRIVGMPYPKFKLRQCWATTLDLGYYVPMVVSIDDTSKGLPSYWPLFSDSKFNIGHTVNDLNNISLINRLYFMVHRDPEELTNYSCVGYTDTINYVNMKNMSTNTIWNGNYPIKTDKYNCFQTGIRRSDIGFKGYAGLAFRMVEDNNSDEQDNNEQEP